MQNKSGKMTAIVFTLLLALAVILVATPAATAQQERTLKVELDKFVDDPNLPNNRILPDTGVAKVDVKAIVIIPQTSGCIVPVTVTFEVRGPAYGSATMNPPSRSVPVQASQNPAVPVAEAERRVSINSVLEITVKRDAPAFDDGIYEVTMKATGAVTSSGQCNLGDSAPLKAPYKLKNDYLPLTSVNAQTLYVKTGQNKKAVFPVDVTNGGNGPTRVTIDLLPQKKDSLAAYNAGSDLRLDTKAGKPAAKNTITRNIEITTPHNNGYTNGIASIAAKFTSRYDGAATGTLQEDVTTINLNVQIQGVYVPGFEPISLIAALGLALLVIGRRRAG